MPDWSEDNLWGLLSPYALVGVLQNMKKQKGLREGSGGPTRPFASCLFGGATKAEISN
jgi:hypothetical protein